MSEGVFSSFAQYGAPLRRFGGSLLARYLLLAAGLIAMTFLTVPELRHSVGIWLSVCLWLCLVYFAAETAAHLVAAARNNAVRNYLVSPSGVVDLLGILPVPIALAAGAPPESAWLFAALWVLKLAQNSPGFAQLGRVFVLEAKPLASVLVLFLIVLFLASAIMHVVERDGQPVGLARCRRACGGRWLRSPPPVTAISCRRPVSVV